MRPPRFLWVPFDLGRPFGAPNEPEFQTEVARTALALLERNDGPVLLDDFPEDAPGGPSGDMSGWVCPISLPTPKAEAGSALLEEVFAEIERLAPWHAFALEERGRTTFGLCKLEIEDVVRFLNGFFDGTPDNPLPDLTLGEAVRLACEDVRSWYHEAATAQPGAASPRELRDWFWGETAVGRFYLALQPVLAKHSDERVRHVATGQFVPRSQRHRLG